MLRWWDAEMPPRSRCECWCVGTNLLTSSSAAHTTSERANNQQPTVVFVLMGVVLGNVVPKYNSFFLETQLHLWRRRKMGGNQDDEDNNFMDTNYEVGFWQVYMLGMVGGFFPRSMTKGWKFFSLYDLSRCGNGVDGSLFWLESWWVESNTYNDLERTQSI